MLDLMISGPPHCGHVNLMFATDSLPGCRKSTTLLVATGLVNRRARTSLNKAVTSRSTRISTVLEPVYVFPCPHARGKMTKVTHLRVIQILAALRYIGRSFRV